MLRLFAIFVAAFLLAVLPHPARAAGCSGPVGNEGDFIYNADYHNMQFCNGTDWISMGSAGGGSASFSPNSATLYDDFVGPGVGGVLDWSSSGFGGAVKSQPDDAVCRGANVLGCMQVSSGASSGYWKYMYILINSTGPVIDGPNPQVNTVTIKGRVNMLGTTGSARFGYFDAIATAPSADGVYFEAQPTTRGDNDWHCVQRSGSTNTEADSGVAVTGSVWHRLEIDFNGSTTVGWKIDGSPVCGSIAATNVPNLNLFPAFETDYNGAAASLDIDYFQMDITTTGR